MKIVKQFLWVLLGLIIVVPIIATLVGVKLDQFSTMGEEAAQMVMPPETVNSYEVKESTWQPRFSAVGSVVAIAGTNVSTEADGVVREIKFEPGSDAKEGDLLVVLDVDVEQSQLRDAEASAQLAKVSFDRARELLQSKNISQAEYDTAAAGIKQALAQIDNIRALIRKKTVRAPFAGKLGIRQISVGQYLQRGNPVVSLQALDPIYVEFSLPQQRIGELAEGLKINITSDSYPGESFTGNVTAINPEIDPSTRTIRVQATLSNKDGRLRPGMFVSVDLVLAKSEQVLFIPETAIVHAPFGDSVYLIVKNDKPEEATTAPLVAKQQFVKLGTRQGDFVAVTEGIKAGDTVISTGVFKLQPGVAVQVDNTLAPPFKLEPTPGNT